MPDALVRIVLQGDEAVAGADRVSQALGRMERSEPTRALRQTRTAIDELANAATGLNPALGRVVSTLAQFSIGGAVGLGVVGGLAAIGVEIKSLLNTVPNLERAFGKLNDEFAHMGGPGATGFANLRALTQRLEDVQEGDWFTQGIGMLRAIGGGKKGQGALGRYEDIADIEAGTESATLRNEINRQHADVTKLHTDALKKHTEELAKTRQQQHISGSVPTTALERIGADLYRRAAFGQGGNLPALSGVTEAGTTAMDNTMRGATEAATRVATSRWDPGPPDPQKRKDLGKDIGLGIAAAFSLAGGATQGGAAAMASGLGGAASALSGISGLSALGPVGAVLGGLGGLFSLFGGKQQVHVLIDGYDSHALSQQQQLMLALTGFKGLSIDVLSTGARDVNRTLYELGRQGRTDGMLRIPPGG